ncbi:hypothetical protein VTN00DRAFT_10266 [Thermoascus crustaceus]|uniref:uncharacterized protein n=1 Tax=Thermoascus crustaceus TaxID=5088 RepID=UPI0037439BF8
MITLDRGVDNLLWDREAKKCYIIDFKWSRKPKELDQRRNPTWVAWDLADTNDYDEDMSLWRL